MSTWYVPGEKYPNRSAPDITAREKASALFALGSAVMIRSHPYDRSPHSGAGNCWCGRDPSSRIHQVVMTDGAIRAADVTTELMDIAGGGTGRE